jgi:SAM-dependent methyltransferase
MQSLYRGGFESIYDDMYQTFINYRDEFDFYHDILKKHNTQSVLEAGCGTGHLAKLFIQSKMDYLGLDLSEDMVNMSQKRNPSGVFIKSDLTNFKLKNPIDAVLITGRTTSYLYTNSDVQMALKSIHGSLNQQGIVCFDFIDAKRFFNEIKGGRFVVHECEIYDRHYRRESYMKENISHDNLMFDWYAKYYDIKKEKKKLLTEDHSTVRAFTKDEWKILLELNNFEPLELIDRKSYAFDTYVIVAKKIS